MGDHRVGKRIEVSARLLGINENAAVTEPMTRRDPLAHFRVSAGLHYCHREGAKEAWGCIVPRDGVPGDKCADPQFVTNFS